MNKNQRLALIGGVAAITIMLLFPPFHLVRQEGTLNMGYQFIGDGGYAVVNIWQLLAQWIVVSLIAGLAWYLLKDRP